ncbi:chondroitinase-B domain-containing protein [Chitinophaga deserti]|uniref:chondroitinase-B domain-containing protein n=1 Tax=Chitinophaga deserti TaxID=2164099 RepID=UPI000D6BF356|nr:chondroitinase-B domain-containing protein [Chitinophaga deserti]
MMKTLPLAALLLWAASAMAAIIPVNTLPALQSAINNASPGDVIVLANGVYTATSNITINRQGTAAKPITITAETVGGAEITGTGGFAIASPAAHIVISGFLFTHSAGKATIGRGTSFCKLIRNVYKTPGEGDNLNVQGDDHELAYNTFRDKAALGQFLSIHVSGGPGTSGSQAARRIWVHHNWFYNQRPGGGNGSETVQFGLSGLSLSTTNSIIEYNLFEKCDGENESLSVKVSGITIRYNTFLNSPAQFTLRHGNFAKVYGNYFLNTPGLRIFGDDHTIHSNHFENCSIALNIGNGSAEVSEGGALTSHDRPDRVLIAFNTLVNNATNIRQAPRTNGLGSTYITGAYNIITNSTAQAVQIQGPCLNPVWKGNIIHNLTNNAGDMPDTSYIVADPLLARDITGTFHLQPGSPAIGMATEEMPGIAVDMDGQPRSMPFDAGADQLSAAPVKALLIDSTHVGTHAGGSNPVVGIQSPLPGSILQAGMPVQFTVAAISLTDTVTFVRYMVDGVEIAADSSRPYSIEWQASYGSHILSAYAVDASGRISDTVSVQVRANPAGASVALTAPLQGSTHVSPVYVDLSAMAVDSISAVRAVAFYSNGTLVAVDSAAPYSYRWMSPPAGNLVLQARSVNTNGDTAFSTEVRTSVRYGQFDVTDNGGVITGQYPNPTKPTEDLPALIDNNPATKYYRSGRTALWIQYASATPAILVRYTLTSGNDRPARDPKDWRLLGSNDGTTWDTLDVRSGETFATRGLNQSYPLDVQMKAYTYFRLDITANNGEANTQLAEWELIEKKQQSISFDSIPAQRYGAGDVVLNAISSTGLPVTFSVTDGPAIVTGNGLQLQAPGMVTVKATAAGNDNYFTADTVQTFEVLKGLQELNFTPVGDKTFGDTAFVLQAASSVGLPVSYHLVSGPVALQDSVVTILGAGEVTVRAIQPGNDFYEADSVEQTFTVRKASQTITFPVIEPQRRLKTVTLEATASTGLPVTYEVVSGVATITGNTVKLLDEGLVTIRAIQAGNENYDTATAEQVILVLGVELVRDPIDITIYPNPTRGPITVRLNKKLDRPYTFHVIDRMGNRVAYAFVPAGAGTSTVSLNLSHLRHDLYFIHVSDGLNKTVRMIMKL